ncbi:probable aspartic protease At2g35615 [Macadamia integrifolia]|uniref:probable aspartic protease At2g35615 n=1 Tax=Macadamia integrifolia TaxID=60698 RepID=UPI001C4ECCDF|nr:probable aspartic protease At2g35615 [Macadamia integrifolia]
MASSIAVLLVFIVSLVSFSPIHSSSSPILYSSPDQETKKIDGFKIRLIHRHSPQSPIYNPNFTASDRLREMVNLSLSRHSSSYSYLNGGGSRMTTTGEALDDIMAAVKFASGTYIMQYSIGTPPTPMWGFVDTTSEIIWLQCQPRKKCYPQRGPIWDSRRSATYKKIQCIERECKYSDHTHCTKGDPFCHYGMSYGDTTTTYGYLSTETLTFRDQQSKRGTISLLNMIFGCGNDNKDGLEDEYNISSGTVGLTKQRLSLISQLDF